MPGRVVACQASWLQLHALLLTMAAPHDCGGCRLLEKSGGKVPVLNEGDWWLPDSDAIAEWAEEKHPEPSLKSNVPAEV
jgi:hypothetical protein